jgi:hypothetical protein
MKHQKAGVRFLNRNDGIGAMLWDPGTGKTGAVLAWVDRLARSQPNKEVRVLVVAPLTATDTWVLQVPDFMDSVVKARVLMGRTDSILAQMRKARKWTYVPDSKISLDHPGILQTQLGGNHVTVLSLSAGALSSYCGTPAHRVALLRAVRAFAPDLIVMDESHMIKAPTSTISTAMYQLGPLAKHRIILTGTVNPHSPLDVYGQWRFLAPWTFSDQHGETYTKTPLGMTKEEWKEVSPWSWDRFQKRYSTAGGYKGKGIGGFQNLQELNDRVAERSHVVLKKDALDLPPVQDVNIHVAMNTAEAKAYQQMCDDLATELDSGEVIEAVNVLAKLMKLRQITSGFAKDTETSEVHNIGSSKRKDVLEVCNVTLAGENRLVVFAYFRAECETLAKALAVTNKGATVEIITGITKRMERKAIRERFGDVSGNPQRMILVAQARTMSISVNELVTAQHGVFASLSERRDDWVQARGRLDRKGQVGQAVTFWNCFVPGTIDEIMLQRHKDRGDLETALLDHVRGVAAARRGQGK